MSTFLPEFAGLSDLFVADFGAPCSKGGRVFRAIFDAPDELVSLGSTGQISTDYSLLVKTSDALSLSIGTGDALTVNGVNYRAREQMQIDDGAFTRVMLTRI